VGLAKLRDGTRLIRVGQALPGELAAWRYGREMRWRRFRAQAALGLGVGAPLAIAAAVLLGPLGAVVASPLNLAYQLYSDAEPARRADRVAHQIPAADSPMGLPLTVRWRDLSLASTAWSAESGLQLRLVQTRELWAGSSPVVLAGPRRPPSWARHWYGSTAREPRGAAWTLR